MTHWQPLPATYGQVGADVARVGLTTVSTAGTTALSLVGAAGAAATVPVAGWIAAAGLGIAAGTVALVGAVAGGKKRKAEAVEMARQLGLPDPEQVPGYLARVLRWNDVKLSRELAQVNAQISRKQRHQQRRGLGKLVSAITQPGTAARSSRRLVAKRALLAAVIQYRRTGGVVTSGQVLDASQVGRSQQVVPVAPTAGGMTQYHGGVIVVGGVVVGILVAWALRRSS